ncbi:thermonuclease family protein [Bradyrhizobium murdochi]|uniref:thermonuclease family protein n=1 Tax=Bradyrhizobium murdochi TaxID=1038859 RepID=UPI0032216A61
MVKDANGVTLAWLYCHDDTQRYSFGVSKLSSDEARRIGKAIARIPEFMMPRQGFYPRGGGPRWREDRPYHVALEDRYIREHWDEINALCRLNSLPLNATGEVIENDGVWRVYEFTWQMDAILFWERFEGRWLRGTEFHYPERPENLPSLKPLENWPNSIRAICDNRRVSNAMIKRRTLLFMLFLLFSGEALSDDLVGQATVVDGDTLQIHGARIRLWGIDAPESSQLCRGEDSSQYRCGGKAATELDAFIARRPVNCSPVSFDPYGRTVATCSVGGNDLGEWLVRKGLALDWPQYSKGRYGGAQREAEHAGRGIWKGSYVEPWLYRGCIRASGKPADCSDDANAHP